MANRMSMYSMASESMGPRGAGQQSSQVSTTTLLNAIHNIYLASLPYHLDAGTSLVVNTWLTATQPGPDGQAGGTVDAALAMRAWEHARRRAEDGCVVLGSLHPSTPSVLVPFLSTLPLSLPPTLFKALDALQPFLRCVAPNNPATQRQTALGVTLTLNLAGNLTAASLALSQGGIDTIKGLLNVPSEPGYRAFDVFYYLLTSASTPAEREFLGLKAGADYSLLARSGTYGPPSYLPTADDGASADDFRAALKEIGIKGSAHRNLISILAGLLKLGNTLDYGVDEEVLDEVCDDVSGLLGVEPDVLARTCSTEDRRIFIGGLYEALVDWVILKANEAIAAQMARIRDGDESVEGSHGARTPNTNEDNGDTVCITVLEVPDPALGKALALRGIFDDTLGINSEMKQDGVDVAAAGSSVLREMENAVSEVGPELGITTGPAGRERSHVLEKREELLEKVVLAADADGFLKRLLLPNENEGVNLGRAGRLDLSTVLGSSRVWYHLSIHPTDESPASLAALPSVNSAWSAGTVSRQLRAWRLPEWANRRNKHLDFTADFDFDEFVQRYAPLGCRDGRDGIESWILERGWSNGEVVVGVERVWMRESAWWEAESMLDLKPAQPDGGMGSRLTMGNSMMLPTMGSNHSGNGSDFFQQPHHGDVGPNGSQDQLLLHQRNASQSALSTGPSPLAGPGSVAGMGGGLGGGLGGGAAPSVMGTNVLSSSANLAAHQRALKGDYGLGTKGDDMRGQLYYNNEGEFIGLDPELADGKEITSQPISTSRRAWVIFVWAMTFWIPSPLLRYVGRMKRPDVRMAWREKVVLCFLIFLMNAIIVFWIVAFGRLLCPNYDKAWTQDQVSTHQGADDFWVSIHGKVYDISKFWRNSHSDIISRPNTATNTQPLAGLNLDPYFAPPLTQSCQGLVTDKSLSLQFNTTLNDPDANHVSGSQQPVQDSKLHQEDWYETSFKPGIKKYYHGDLVWDKKMIASEGENNNYEWVIYQGKVYDLSNYFYTLKMMNNLAQYKFLNSDLTDAVKQAPGTDITHTWNNIIEAAAGNQSLNANVQNSLNCIDNNFYVGLPDFRNTARCQANGYVLLAFTIVLCCVIAIKFLSALQFGSKRRPAPQDKFVICQVPAYTEGEDSLRKALDSLTALQYDNKRKLICVICDGVIVGAGNDRPTPKIVLDILGVDPKVDPPALPFKSVGTGSEQLNYGKVYSGLYEFEGNVVPYLVIVKVGKESEQSKTKPGNRGKRDSQILVMSFLNRVHHRIPMNPLELEMFHQINNVIGVDPELYEYLLMVDADTCVREDSLNRLVAACANDAKIAGICGETSLQNEERSWWTMIQVYEYFISHHMAKAFESLFGSVTCLPGCFSMYRLRTADRGKPLIISDAVIREYSDCHVDTLHKKNLLSLGEDRYLTTLMTKHFPYMSYKFIADAYCQTAAPEKWSVLLSQRRRWINSTIHNLVELMFLPEMCGFCCFSMRFVVFIDLFGTIILPATCAYLAYLIYSVASHTGAFPLFSIIILASVYGLQAIIFIVKRQWQHVGWMIIYILAYPVYSLILPIYSFWNQDNFSWGNTRIVIGEKGKRQIVAVDDEGFDPRSIPLQRWDDYALANNLPGRRGGGQNEKGMGMGGHEGMYDDGYEMDDIKSVYSSVRQPSVLAGLGARGSTFMPPQSQSSPGLYGRSSTVPHLGFPDHNLQARQSMASMGMGVQRVGSPYQDAPGGLGAGRSMSNLRSMSNTSPNLGGQIGLRGSTANLGYAGGARTPLGATEAGHQSVMSFDFQRGHAGPDDGMIVEAIQAVLREVDLDTVTKKQVRALVEQRLQTELVGERRTFMDRQIDNELANM
ncbi:chitin synthase 6 [Niveomyces insectorum RCEF 264]|uniref:chitin synthase n=1 Tax=Niveomyces insectorum RCEF 264 TaxID=1081102 RepID=A0A168A7T4_9HYPO|nr:chitin synthase 6 [Niveomyces insectorum RCEF 264]